MFLAIKIHDGDFFFYNFFCLKVSLLSSKVGQLSEASYIYMVNFLASESWPTLELNKEAFNQKKL